MHNTIKLLFFSILLAAGMVLNGQQSNTFYLMHDVPQSNLLNPAVQLQCKWFVGIPGFASTHISYGNTAFSYKDLAGSDTWNLEGVFDQMHRVDLYTSDVIHHLVSVGHKHKSLYFTFNISEKAQAYQTVPRDLIEIALHGNGPSVGETVRFDALRSAAYYNREYAFGISKLVNRFWTFGLKGKLLFGKANLYSSDSDMVFSTDENSFKINMEGFYNLNSSLPITISQAADGSIDEITLNEISYREWILNRSNPGFAIDLGVIYRVDEKITLSASLLDLGFMRWRDDLNKVNATGAFIFEGVDPEDDVVSTDFLRLMIDSIINSFDLSVSHSPYVSYFPAQLFLGASYQVKDNISLGVVSRNVIYRSKVHSSLTLSAQGDLADKFLATISWSYLNNSLKNIGAGIAYHGKGFQLHMVSDNLLGFFYPFDTRTLNLRAGANIIFGCPRNKREVLQGEIYGQMPQGGNCSWTDKPKKREKRMKRAARKQNSN